jgi:thymidylate synthase
MHLSQLQSQHQLRFFQTLQETYRRKTGYYQLTNGQDLSDVTYRVLHKLVHLPGNQVSRAGETKELSPHQFHIAADAYGEPNPVTILPGRGNNPFATVAETLWVFAGRNDIKTLSKWLPRAAEFSDDGATWTSGYGPRLRAWIDHNFKTFDQIETVLRRLKKNPESRQALINLWDPASDGQKEGSKDYTCNIVVHFLVRNGGLNMFVTTRSNDIIYGVTVNVFEWCFLGYYVAYSLGYPFRHYYHTGSSLHLYGWKMGTARRVLSSPYAPLPLVETAATPGTVNPMAGLKNAAPLLPRPPANSLTPLGLQQACQEIYNAAFNNRLDAFDVKYLASLPPRLADFVYALRAETKLDTSGSEYLAALAPIRYTPLLFSLLDAGLRRRKEALWLCKGFTDLFADTASEIAAARYLKHLYKASVEKPPEKEADPK